MPISGKFGVVDGVSTMMSWSVNETNNTNRYRASNTRAGSARNIGARDWSGSFNVLGVPTVMPGDVIDFIGYIGPSTGVEATTGKTREGQAIVESVAITWDFAANKPIFSAVNFGGHLALSHGTGIYGDETDPSIYDVEGLELTYGADALGAGTTVIPGITQAVLTFKTDLQTYVNSSTDGWTGRIAGPIDWTLALTQQEVDDVTALNKNDVKAFLLPIGAGDARYLLEWGRVKESTGISVDRDSGGIVSQTVNVEMHGHDGTAVGQILLPGATTPWWPFT